MSQTRKAAYYLQVPLSTQDLADLESFAAEHDLDLASWARQTLLEEAHR